MFSSWRHLVLVVYYTMVIVCTHRLVALIVISTHEVVMLDNAHGHLLLLRSSVSLYAAISIVLVVLLLYLRVLTLP